MKKMLTLFALILAIGLGAPIAEAKKLGGGKSFGKSYKTAPAQPAPTAAPVNGKNPTLAAAPKKSGMMRKLDQLRLAMNSKMSIAVQIV